MQPPDGSQAAQFLPGAYMSAEQLAAAGEGMDGYDAAAAAAAAAAAGGSYQAVPSYPPNADANVQGELHGVGQVTGTGAGPTVPTLSQPTLARQIAQLKGVDPLSNDTSSTAGLANAFGISKGLAKDIKEGSRVFNIRVTFVLIPCLLCRDPPSGGYTWRHPSQSPCYFIESA